jgi:hypothetical protein
MKMVHRNAENLEAGLDEILQSPKDAGTVEMIVCRPGVDAREILDEGALDVAQGLIGDNWGARGSSMTPDGTAHPEMQLTLMNSRVIALVAASREEWPLAGDQFYVDLDLGNDNLPPGALLEIGAAVVEVSSIPHTGCKKFVERFGMAAMKFVNSPRGLEHALRGINAKVVKSGVVRKGDTVKKVS